MPLPNPASRPELLMTPAFSVFLDLLRFLAAFLVVAGHLTLPYFSKGWPNLVGMAYSMVAVFFVLSGFVIRYTVDARPDGPRAYFIHRMARIYSVLVPAVILTLLLDSLSRHVNPNFYNFRFHEAATDPGMRVAAVLLFFNQAYGQDLALMSNSPVWSIGYEVPYYLLFGCYHYFRGWARWLPIGLILAITGPNLYVLFPLWVMGCGLYTMTRTQAPSPRRGLCHAGLLVLMASVFAAVPADQWPALREHFSAYAFLWQGRSYEFPAFYAAGLLTLLLVLAVYHCQSWLAAGLLRLQRPAKALAGGAFSLYLYHFPILVAIRCTIPYDRADAAAKVAILLVTVLACYALARLTETRKATWVRWLTHCTEAMARAWRRPGSQA